MDKRGTIKNMDKRGTIKKTWTERDTVKQRQMTEVKYKQ